MFPGYHSQMDKTRSARVTDSIQKIFTKYIFCGENILILQKTEMQINSHLSEMQRKIQRKKLKLLLKYEFPQKKHKKHKEKYSQK